MLRNIKLFLITVKILKMYCKYCLKNQDKKIELIRFSDAYSCPSCYLVSNEIVFGNQTYNSNSFSSHDYDICSYNELFNNINSEIENACIYFNLTRSIIINSNKIFLNLIKKKFKSSYSHEYYKAYSILKACSENKDFIDTQILCSFFCLNFSKFLKFQKYLLNKNMGYFHPSNISQECHNILNILNVKNYTIKKKIIDLTLCKIKKSDISPKIILLYVYCDHFKIIPKSSYFKKICLELNVNVYTAYKNCIKLTKM